MKVAHHVAIADVHAHLLSVRTTIRAQVGEVLPDPLVVFMPVWTPGSYLIREYARHVERLRRLDDPKGAATKVRKNAWSLPHGGKNEVEFTYELYCNDLTVRTNHVDISHVYLNGAATFFTPETSPDVGAQVTFDLPKSLHIATALPELEPGTFVATNFDQLVDCPIHAGEKRPTVHEMGGKPHVFAVWGEAKLAVWADVVRDVKTIVETESRLLGGLPFDRYVFLWLLSSKLRGGLEHFDSTTLAVQPGMFDDRKGYLDVLSLVAHEYLHLWNVKRIRPAGLTPYQYEAENYTRLLWWFEGGTSYFDWRILRLADLCTVEEYLDHLGDELGALEDTPGRRAQSIADASFDAWVKLYRADENTVNSTVSYYLKGEIVNALLDIELRARTGGQRGLDDVLVELWRVYGKQGQPVPENGLPAVFARVAGQPMDDVLERWVESCDELPVEAVFAKVGLKITRDRGNEKSRHGSLGARLRSVDGKAVVSAVLRGRAGHHAGLDVGDEIVAIGGKRVIGTQIDLALNGLKAGDHVDVLVSRDAVLKSVVVKLDQPNVEHVKISLDPASTPVARSLLDGWLRGLPSL